MKTITNEVKMKEKATLFRRFSSNQQDTISGYLFISPFIIGFLSFIVVPMGISLYMAFHNYDMLTEATYIGFANFKRIFTNDPKFKQSLMVTFKYVAMAVPLRLTIALAVAMLINRPSKLTGAYRVLFYIPSVIGGSVAVSIMWRNIFGDTGLINGVLTSIGLDPVYFFKNPTTALLTLVLLAGWQFGSSMLIFLSGLKNIPIDYYEAAMIDGAGKVRQFFSITLPCLTPILFFNLVMQTIQSFLTFTPAYIISNGSGAPRNGTLVYSLYIYQKAFSDFKMGYASALAWILIVIIGTVTMLLFLTSKFWVFSESEEV
ncbi:carbohydrate ABC transporter permease [Enterococcus lemanii]|uniref:Carbohydrate ABC transporter permease n=1 Tax=Enterococcus lemanii TaxID=1159752 RepID=A0ABV9N000_9ENTE|nr:sugar ABC transporter permease [Enterococcus lemanii]MBM7708266.1 multiple sugar transport system permease protein [Enterococcus lemanii]